MSDQRNPGPSDTFADDREAVHSRFDWSETIPSVAVIKAVAAISGQEPTSLPKLFAAIDPDALDAICRRETSNREDETIQLTFPYDGRDVTVRSDGEVIVTPQLRGA